MCSVENCKNSVYTTGLCHKHYDQNRYQSRKAEFIESAGAWSKANPEKRAAINARYLQRNLKKHSANQFIRKRRVKQATPPWADIANIKKFYEDRPKGVEVDHIIPLANPLVCGLHVEWNLQYLSPKENREKGIKYGKRLSKRS